MTEPAQYKLLVYLGNDSQWYWRMKARNGRVVADGSQGYESHSACLKAARRVAGATFKVGYDRSYRALALLP